MGWQQHSGISTCTTLGVAGPCYLDRLVVENARGQAGEGGGEDHVVWTSLWLQRLCSVWTSL